MYSHIAKGFTVGEVFTRRLCRGIFGIPGTILDHFIAIFYSSNTGNYSAYWDENGITYLDNTRVGVLQGFTGYLGDLLGYLVGGIVGGAIGAALYFPDGVLKSICWAHDKIQENCTHLAQKIATSTHFNDFVFFSHPENYAQKAWNISSIGLGFAIASPFYLAAKVVEFLIPPLGHSLSGVTLGLGSVVGGAIGTMAALAAWPVKHLCNKAVELYRGFRNKVQSLTALIYAKSNEEPVITNPSPNGCCITPESIHSTQFRTKVKEFKQMTTTQLLCGEVIQPPLPNQPDDTSPPPSVAVDLVPQNNIQASAPLLPPPNGAAFKAK